MPVKKIVYLVVCLGLLFLAINQMGDYYTKDSLVTINPNCLPYQQTITEEFYALTDRTCLANLSKPIYIICPLNESEDFAGKSMNGDEVVYIIINNASQNTFAHELNHAWQFICGESRFDFCDNWTMEGIAALYGDVREYNPCYCKEEEDWLREGLNHSQKEELMETIFAYDGVIDREWLEEKKTWILQ